MRYDNVDAGVLQRHWDQVTSTFAEYNQSYEVFQYSCGALKSLLYCVLHACNDTLCRAIDGGPGCTSGVRDASDELLEMGSVINHGLHCILKKCSQTGDDELLTELHELSLLALEAVSAVLDLREGEECLLSAMEAEDEAPPPEEPTDPEESGKWKKKDPPKPIDVVLRYSCSDGEAMAPMQQVLGFLLSRLKERSLMLSVDGEAVYERHRSTDPGFRNVNTHAWKECGTLRHYVETETAPHANWDMWTKMNEGNGNVYAIMNYLKQSQDVEALRIKPNRNFVSFRNGIYQFHDPSLPLREGVFPDRFYPYADPGAMQDLDESIVTLGYKDVDMDFDRWSASNEDGPLFWRETTETQTDSPWMEKWMKMFKTQHFDELTYQWICALMGRLFYDVGDLDQWQVGVMLYGEAGTGKSTLIDIVLSVFHPNDVGTLSSNIEEKFGLGALCDKLVYSCQEVKRDFTLNQGDWQSMITGETVSIAVKHELARSVAWTIGGVLAGNEYMAWLDTLGSLTRRLVAVHYNNRVNADGETSDPDIKDYCKEHEIAKILFTCNRWYLTMCSKYGAKSIWGTSGDGRPIMGEFLAHECLEKTRKAFDPIYNFVTSPSVFEITSNSSDGVPIARFVEKYNSFEYSSDNKHLLPSIDVQQAIFHLRTLRRPLDQDAPLVIDDDDNIAENRKMVQGLRETDQRDPGP